MQIGFSLPLGVVLGWLEHTTQGIYDEAFRGIPDPPVDATSAAVSTAWASLQDTGFEVCLHLPSPHHFERDRVR